MPSTAIPRKRDDALYSAVLQTLRKHPKPVLVVDLKKEKHLERMVSRPTRINEVVDCLGKTHKIQLGYNEDGKLVVASIEKPFPFSKTPPLRADGNYKHTRKNAKKARHTPPPQAAAPAAPAIEETAAPAAPAPAAQPSLNGFLPSHASLDTMARQFAETIAATLVDRIMEAISLQLPAQLNAAVEQYKGGGKPKVDRPKVIIAGLLPQQAGLMVQEFGQSLDFAFIESQEASNSKRIDALLASHDYVYAMTGFMSHSLDGKLKVAPNFHRIPGGLSSLRAQLQALIVLKSKPQTH